MDGIWKEAVTLILGDIACAVTFLEELILTANILFLVGTYNLGASGGAVC